MIGITTESIHKHISFVRKRGSKGAGEEVAARDTQLAKDQKEKQKTLSDVQIKEKDKDDKSESSKVRIIRVDGLKNMSEYARKKSYRRE